MSKAHVHYSRSSHERYAACGLYIEYAPAGRVTDEPKQVSCAGCIKWLRQAGILRVNKMERAIVATDIPSMPEATPEQVLAKIRAVRTKRKEIDDQYKRYFALYLSSKTDLDHLDEDIKRLEQRMIHVMQQEPMSEP